MRLRRFFYTILLLSSIGLVQSCGTVVISSRPNMPPPPWFYPNRVEAVRYVYFPNHMIYYDLSLRHYIYLNNNVWVTAKILPQRYRNINLSRSRFVHIKGYRGDDISRYHRENNTNRRRTGRRSNTRNGND
ncbi:hypothetical protein [Winogradskyella sp.]|uniref:hypothetical protein n=1 Tax=Winogradskyella sp. TaxID=1883156 RepID=UPI0025DB63D1|nr:hypothetical protein [Winogradskyella sp.]